MNFNLHTHTQVILQFTCVSIHSKSPTNVRNAIKVSVTAVSQWNFTYFICTGRTVIDFVKFDFSGNLNIHMRKHTGEKVRENRIGNQNAFKLFIKLLFLSPKSPLDVKCAKRHFLIREDLQFTCEFIRGKRYYRMRIVIKL